MLTMTILAVGRLKENYLTQAIAEYTKRLSAFGKLQIVEIPEYRLPPEPSPAQIAQGLLHEGDDILLKIPARAFVTALCIEGKALSSPQLAEELKKASASSSHAVFVIGGSFGLDERVKAAANLRLSMSAMTFPHQLARVLLCEQLYRAHSIIAGGKYHK